MHLPIYALFVVEKNTKNKRKDAKHIGFAFLKHTFCFCKKELLACKSLEFRLQYMVFYTLNSCVLALKLLSIAV